MAESRPLIYFTPLRDLHELTAVTEEVDCLFVHGQPARVEFGPAGAMHYSYKLAAAVALVQISIQLKESKEDRRWEAWMSTPPTQAAASVLPTARGRMCGVKPYLFSSDGLPNSSNNNKKCG